MIVINFQAQLEKERKGEREEVRNGERRKRGREERRNGGTKGQRKKERKSLLSQIVHLSLDKKAHLPERLVHS